MRTPALKVFVTLATLTATLIAVRPSAADAQASDDNTYQQSTRSVLVLHTYGPAVPFRAAFDASFEQAVQELATEPLDVYTETLDNSRFPGDEAAIVMRDYLLRRYAGRRPGVVVAVLDGAFEFLQRFDHELFPNVPIVYILSSQPAPDAAAVRITGIWRWPPYRETIEVALRLDPQVREVVVIDGALGDRGGFEREIANQLQAFADRLTVTFLRNLPLDEVLAAVGRAPEHSIILFSRQLLRTRRETMSQFEALAEVVGASRVPIYGVAEPLVGHGIVGGYVFDTAANATRTAEMVLKIAGGVRPAELSPITGVVRPMFDWRQLRKWKVPADRLPAGAVVRFQEFTFWERYRSYVLGVGSLLVAQTVLISGLLLQRARRRRAEAALETSMVALRESSEQVRELVGRLIVSQEDERRHIARELHDDLCQALALLTIELDQLSQQPDGFTPKAGDRLRTIAARAGDLATSVHRMSYRLHPSQLEALGLVSALAGLFRDVSRQHNIAVDFQHDQLPRDIAPDARLCLFRVAQEALHNIVKHSRASQAFVQLRRSGNEIVLQVADPGVGFAVAEARQGLGLVSMRERVHFLNGRIVIHSHPGGGTRLGVSLPFAGDAIDAATERPAVALIADTETMPGR